ncbi:MAG: hypothetical protein ACXWUE_06140 [Polyangiales bacterium]
MTMLRNVTFVAVFAMGCTQEIGSTGASSNAVEPTSAAADAGKRPMPVMADVVPLGDDGKPQLDGEHLRVPFFLPPPPADDAEPPPACVVHRAADSVDPGEPPAPPKDAPPPPDAAPPKDAKPGPLALQIAIFGAGADAGKKPDVVVQCLAKPGEERISVPRAILDEALSGVAAGATARVILAGFPMPPEKPADGATDSSDAKAPPPPPMGRGVFLDVSIADSTSRDAPLTHIALPKM